MTNNKKPLNLNRFNGFLFLNKRINKKAIRRGISNRFLREELCVLVCFNGGVCLCVCVWLCVVCAVDVCVYAYVCVCAWVFVRVLVCIYMGVSVCLHQCVFVSVSVCLCVCPCVSTSLLGKAYALMCPFICICACTCVSVGVSVCSSVGVSVCSSAGMSVCLCVCVRMHHLCVLECGHRACVRARPWNIIKVNISPVTQKEGLAPETRGASSRSERAKDRTSRTLVSGGICTLYAHKMGAHNRDSGKGRPPEALQPPGTPGAGVFLPELTGIE